MLFPVFLKILDLILMVGPENLIIGDGLGTSIEEMYYYFEFLNKFEVPNSSQKNPENWMLDYSNWKKNKENNMKFLIQKIEMHAKYTHKIMNKIEKEWIDKFHISNVVKLQEFNDLQTQLLGFEISEEYLLK